jgi:aldose 1-epimerase
MNGVLTKMKIAILLLALTVPSVPVRSANQTYTAERTIENGVDIVRLTDSASGVEVSIAPSLGNRLYEMKVHGRNILNSVSDDVGDFRKRIETGLGIPFLAPWAGRLGEQDFWANGKEYTFNTTLGNIRGPNPVHGLLATSPFWEVTEVNADKHSAKLTSRLQFWMYPDLMAQWPFAHEYEITYKLAAGVLEVRTAVTNLSADPMPVVVGFHPCFRIPDVERDEWTATIAARKVVVADARLVATGEFKPLDLPNRFSVKGQSLDTGFTDLTRDAEGRAHFSIESGKARVEILFGSQYTAAVIYTPPGRQTVCFEPMAGITNAVNLHHEGKYPDLQILVPGAKWIESFWVHASGF